MDTHHHVHTQTACCAWGSERHGEEEEPLQSSFSVQRSKEMTQLMLQVRTCIHKHRRTGKEGHSRGSSCCYYSHSTQRGTQKRIRSCQTCIADLEPFLGKSRVIAGFGELCLLVKLSVN